MDFSIPEVPRLKSIPEHAFDALVLEIDRFQQRLTGEQEVGVVANGAGLIIHVGQLRFSGQMIVFDGVDGDGREARLIQHYTQANVQMIAVQKLADQPRRIGF
ncbi:hypothetical protein LQ953_12100 [Sphingomonas sp. IC-56]|uniref:hypothetical protein n=1 Tax=Sphingomonas sp. IC-56 TaxID=2898529 RepID=UPI001E4BB57D|nr:hypothetical protein [Sphingomonas sp. IC-56]MCD2324757.1 hypothetical protein [Sphingomonas sp. IC-56]